MRIIRSSLRCDYVKGVSTILCASTPVSYKAAGAPQPSQYSSQPQRWWSFPVYLRMCFIR